MVSTFHTATDKSLQLGIGHDTEDRDTQYCRDFSAKKGERSKDSRHINNRSACKMEDAETGALQCLLITEVSRETLFGLEGWKRKKEDKMQLGGDSTY